MKALFLEGNNADWVASVPEPLASVIEPHMLRLRKLHPVSSVRLADGSIVYWGAPRESMTSLADQYLQSDVVAPPDRERRSGVRVPLACAMRYETGSLAHKKTGEGTVIDISSSGVAFTTESSLHNRARVALHIQWPVRLEEDVPVELFATGKVVRAEQTKAAIQYDQIAFKIANA
ncbi:MAG: PilZ domain-containing protein [Acidobacteriota bacterium]|nr:PilZ domain-containing protein [Acidobacteriota bacterium]